MCHGVHRNALCLPDSRAQLSPLHLVAFVSSDIILLRRPRNYLYVGAVLFRSISRFDNFPWRQRAKRVFEYGVDNI